MQEAPTDGAGAWCSCNPLWGVRLALHGGLLCMEREKPPGPCGARGADGTSWVRWGVPKANGRTRTCDLPLRPLAHACTSRGKALGLFGALPTELRRRRRSFPAVTAFNTPCRWGETLSLPQWTCGESNPGVSLLPRCIYTLSRLSYGGAAASRRLPTVVPSRVAKARRDKSPWPTFVRR